MTTSLHSRSAWLIFAMGLAGCSGEATVQNEKTPLVAGTTQTVYVTFDGVFLELAAQDEAPRNRSKLTAGRFASWAPASSTARPHAEALAMIVDGVRRAYAPYDVAIVTERPPPTQPYAMVVVTAGDASAVSSGLGPNVVGVSPIDCANANAATVSFVFPEQRGPTTEGEDEQLLSIANAIAHEVGHGLGLSDTFNAADIMFPVVQPVLTFGGLAGIKRPGSDRPNTSTCDLEGATEQDSHGRLLATVGPHRDTPPVGTRGRARLAE